MRIVDLIDKKSISLNLKAKNKQDAINKLVDLVNNSGNLNDKLEYKEVILILDNQSTTGIGDVVAIPHAKTKSVKKACLAAVVYKKGVDYEYFDGSLSNLFFMISAPEGANNTHLEVLSGLSTILMDEDFRVKLVSSQNEDEFLNLINYKEKEKFPLNEKFKESKDVYTKYPKVLVVTACPTGIAHTFMLAESLNKQAEKMGVSIKVETNGSC